MSNTVSFTLGPLVAASANNILTSITPTSGTALTLNGSTVTGGVATLDMPRRILLTFGSEGSARTLVLTGTNLGGMPIQETLAVPASSSSTAYTTQDFLTVTSALPLGGGWTNAITIGTNGIASSPWKFTNSRAWGPTEIAFSGVVSGTVNWGIEYTYQNPNSNMMTLGGPLGNYPEAIQAWTHPTVSNQSGNYDGFTDNPIRAWRGILNSGTGSVVITSMEGGMH